MAPTEFEQLLEQVKRTDLSVNNPEMQTVIEHELTKWVRSYEEKRNPIYSLSDCFGGPGEIPDVIPVNGASYSPPQILEHVKARDPIGMGVITIIDTYWKQHPLWPGKDIAVMFSDRSQGLDEVVIQCVCGEHSQTTRDLMMGIIHPDPESPLLTAGITCAIMR